MVDGGQLCKSIYIFPDRDCNLSPIGVVYIFRWAWGGAASIPRQGGIHSPEGLYIFYVRLREGLYPFPDMVASISR